MEPSRPMVKRNIGEHVTPKNGDRRKKNGQKLGRTRKEVPGQSGFENADWRPMLHFCHIKLHSSVTIDKICNSDQTKLGVSNDHLSLSTTSKSGIESHSRSELNETQNPCKMKVSNQSTSYRISYVIVPDMVCLIDSHISDEIPYKSVENMLN
ncbi:unnamed protein product [Schistosoma margrebowiei]|uniref:Uncharacterized protein n=1 Tax=Schistosoma margrebowiei TaxID=48269 RepID=A0A183LHG4_9TREM|nr:unnamed protein product [Schistosoma margrebowiei]